MIPQNCIVCGRLFDVAKSCCHQADKANLERQLSACKDEIARLASGWNAEKLAREQAEADLATERERRERLEVQLAGCSVAALGGTKDVASRDDWGWSCSYQDVLDLRLNYEAERERLDWLEVTRPLHLFNWSCASGMQETSLHNGQSHLAVEESVRAAIDAARQEGQV